MFEIIMIWLLLTKYTHSTTTHKTNASFAVEVNLIFLTNFYYMKAISNHVIDIHMFI